MANVLLYDLAAMTVASTGTGTITLGSAARINGVLFLTFAQAGISNGDTVAYSILDPAGASECGFGVYTSAGTTLTRNVTKSTNSNSAINMSAAAIVRISARVEDIGTPGQRPGTTTNDNASAGNVGEFMQGMTDASTAATFTVTIASPAVVTQAGHNYTSTGTGIFVPTTTGALPTGLTAGTVYYVIPTTVSGNTFQLATSIANAFAGTAVNTSGSQSGTHTGSAFRSLTNNTQADLAAVQLTAGDWMLSGSAYYVAANTTTTSYVSVGIGTASATLPSQQVYVNQFQVTFPSTGPANSPISPTRRISVASGATQIAYLVGLVGFGVSTYTGGGQISAWRIR